MYESVRSSFNSFTKTLEGRVPWMYLDIKGLVTVAVGNLIDPVDAALSLPFVHKTDNTPATKDEIQAEWTNLKAKTDLATKGYKACESITNLRLTDPAMDALVDSKLMANETAVKKSFTNWDTWPADAQLGVLSMAWALGAGFAAKWPKFAAAATAGDWATAASNCSMDTTGNAGVVKRNEADIQLFKNAAAVLGKKLDASKLYYPADANTVSPNGQTDPSSQNTNSSSSSNTNGSSSSTTSSPSTDASSQNKESSGSSSTDSSASNTDSSSSTTSSPSTDASSRNKESSGSSSTDSSASNPDSSSSTDSSASNPDSSSSTDASSSTTDSSASSDTDWSSSSADSSSSSDTDASSQSTDVSSDSGDGDQSTTGDSSQSTDSAPADSSDSSSADATSSASDESSSSSSTVDESGDDADTSSDAASVGSA